MAYLITPVPPEAVTVMIPLAAPLHVTGVTTVLAVTGNKGSVIVTTPVEITLQS